MNMYNAKILGFFTKLQYGFVCWYLFKKKTFRFILFMKASNPRPAVLFTPKMVHLSLGTNTYLYISLINLTIQPDTNHYSAHLSTRG